AQSIPYQPAPGWKLILGTWLGVWDDFMVNGLDFRMWPFWLLGFSDVLLILYLIRNLYLIKKDVNHNGNKLLSLMLLGVAGALLFNVLLGDQPLLGYWLINLGLLSSAVLEWTTANLDLQIRK